MTAFVARINICPMVVLVKKGVRLSAIGLVIFLTLLRCSKKGTEAIGSHGDLEKTNFNLLYNHFEGGVLFTDIRQGLDVLWKASFINGKILYKENVAYFVPAGLLILPNSGNTRRTSQLGALPHYINDGKMFVSFENRSFQILGIIHTHPDIFSVDSPAPITDFQYCQLGIHNYVMNHLHLFDAYKNERGQEVFDVLGSRNFYIRNPFTISTDRYSISLTIGKSTYRSMIVPIVSNDLISATNQTKK